MAGSPPASMPAGESRKVPGCWSSIPMWKSRVDSWARSSRDSITHEADPDGPPGIVGFGLRNPDGSPQGSVGVFPTLARTIREQFIPRSRRKYQAGWRIRSGPVDWVTGACMLVNSAMIAELGGMDEDFFLYYEEVAFSRAAQRQGWRVEYDPSVTRRPPTSLAKSGDFAQDAGHHPAQQAALFPQALAALAVLKSWPRSCGSRRRSGESGRDLVGRREEARAWRTIGDLSRPDAREPAARARRADSGRVRPGSATPRKPFPPVRRAGQGARSRHDVLIPAESIQARRCEPFPALRRGGQGGWSRRDQLARASLTLGSASVTPASRRHSVQRRGARHVLFILHPSSFILIFV